VRQADAEGDVGHERLRLVHVRRRARRGVPVEEG
jgi:hypothetical protein